MSVVDNIKDWFLLRTWKFWTFSILGIILAVALAFGIMYYINITTKLATPTGAGLYQTSTGQVYAEVQKVENAKEYEFIISKTDGTIQSFIVANNKVEVSSFVNKGGDYNCKVRALGKTEQAHSDFGTTVSFTKTTTLKTPTISFNNDATQINFSFSDVFYENVVLNFSLYYNQTDHYDAYSVIPASSNSVYTGNVEITGFFDLASFRSYLIGLGITGQVLVSVQANSPNLYYLNSYISNQLVVNI